MAIFIKFGDFDGGATLAGHTGYSIATRFRWGGKHNIAVSGDAQRTGRRQYQPCVITKPVDSTSTELIGAFAQNARMQISVRSTNVADRIAGNVSFELIFKAAGIVAFEYDFSEGSLVENISIDFGAFELTYFDPVTGGGRSNFGDELFAQT